MESSLKGLFFFPSTALSPFFIPATLLAVFGAAEMMPSDTTVPRDSPVMPMSGHGHDGGWAWGGLTFASSAALVLVGYALLCSLLRFRRLNYMRSRFNYPDRASLAHMTNQDAYDIIKITTCYEFPFFYDLGLRFALLKASLSTALLPLALSSGTILTSAPRSIDVFGRRNCQAFGDHERLGEAV